MRIFTVLNVTGKPLGTYELLSFESPRDGDSVPDGHCWEVRGNGCPRYWETWRTRYVGKKGSLKKLGAAIVLGLAGLLATAKCAGAVNVNILLAGPLSVELESSSLGNPAAKAAI
jgi:hypothetical protein